MSLNWKKVSSEAKLLLIGVPVLIWTLFPLYHMFLFAISPRDTATSGVLWPEKPTLQNFEIVFKRDHFYLFKTLRLFSSVTTSTLTISGNNLVTPL